MTNQAQISPELDKATNQVMQLSDFKAKMADDNAFALVVEQVRAQLSCLDGNGSAPLHTSFPPVGSVAWLCVTPEMLLIENKYGQNGIQTFISRIHQMSFGVGLQIACHIESDVDFYINHIRELILNKSIELDVRLFLDLLEFESRAKVDGTSDTPRMIINAKYAAKPFFSLNDFCSKMLNQSIDLLVDPERFYNDVEAAFRGYNIHHYLVPLGATQTQMQNKHEKEVKGVMLERLDLLRDVRAKQRILRQAISEIKG